MPPKFQSTSILTPSRWSLPQILFSCTRACRSASQKQLIHSTQRMASPQLSSSTTSYSWSTDPAFSNLVNSTALGCASHSFSGPPPAPAISQHTIFVYPSKTWLHRNKFCSFHLTSSDIQPRLATDTADMPPHQACVPCAHASSFLFRFPQQHARLDSFLV